MQSTQQEIDFYKQQLEQDASSRAFVPLAECYRRIGEYEQAMTYLKQGLEFHPHYLGAKIALARVYFEYGELPLAEEILSEAVRFVPDNILVLRILSQIYVLQQQHEQALPLLKRLLSLEPQDEKALALVNSIQSVVRDKPDQDEVARAPESKPMMATQTATLAQMYEEQGHHDKAQSIYQNLTPTSQDAHAVVTSETTSATKVSQLQTLLSRIQERRRSHEF